MHIISGSLPYAKRLAGMGPALSPAPLRPAPRSSRLNGCVERAQRTHTEEFYEVTPFPLELAALNRALRAWEHIYNTVRPHQGLGYLTPQQCLRRHHALRGQGECH